MYLLDPYYLYLVLSLHLFLSLIVFFLSVHVFAALWLLSLSVSNSPCLHSPYPPLSFPSIAVTIFLCISHFFITLIVFKYSSFDDSVCISSITLLFVLVKVNVDIGEVNLNWKCIFYPEHSILAVFFYFVSFSSFFFIFSSLVSAGRLITTKKKSSVCHYLLLPKNYLNKHLVGILIL